MHCPHPPPTDPNHVLLVAEKARAFLKPLIGTDVSIERVEKATGYAWCPAHAPDGQTFDPFLCMRLQGMSNSALEAFLKSLEGMITSMPDACVSVQSKSDSIAVCGELWNELREPLATWMSHQDFVARVDEVCDRATNHYVGVARAQLIEQLAGMRTLGRVCCARPSDQSGIVQHTVQDEAFVRTITNPCAILKEEMKQARVPLEELSTCLEFECSANVRGPAALAPCLAAKQFGLLRWAEEHGSGASIALTACINRVRRLIDPALGVGAWSAVTVCHCTSPMATQSASPVVIPLPTHHHMHAFEKLVIVTNVTPGACVAPLRAVRIASVVKQLASGNALLPRTFSASTLMALLARVVAEARAQGATHTAMVHLMHELAPPVVEDEEDDDDFSDEEEDEGEEDEPLAHLEHLDGGYIDNAFVPASPLLHIKAAANAPENGLLVRMPPRSGAAGVPAALLRESAVFAALHSLLTEANCVGKDVMRVTMHEVSNRAALCGTALGKSTNAVSQNTSVVLRRFVPYLNKYVEGLGQKLKECDICFMSDVAWRGPGRCVCSTTHGRDWALLCLTALQRRIHSDPSFANEWHGNRKNKSKARRRALKATHTVATSTAAAALAE